MRILILTTTLDERCGGGRYSWEIVKRLQGVAGVHVRIAVADTSGKPQEERVLPRAGGFYTSFFFLFKLRRMASGVDIVHCFDGYPLAWYGLCAVLGRKSRLIINGVGTRAVLPLARLKEHGWSLTEWCKAKLLIFAYRRADRIISISHYTQRQIALYVRNVKVKSRLIFLGVDQKAFAGSARDRPHVPVRILSVGALKWRKGQHITLQALALLKGHFPGISLTVVGDTGSFGYDRMLQSFAQELGKDSTVTFLHGIDETELKRHYEAHDVFVMPSLQRGEHFEGFGLVYLEAAALGLPSVGCWETGAEDAIRDGETGYLVPQHDPQAVAEAIAKIISNAVEYTRLSRNAVEFARGLTWENTVEEYVRVYREICHEHRLSHR